MLDDGKSGEVGFLGATVIVWAFCVVFSSVPALAADDADNWVRPPILAFSDSGEMRWASTFSTWDIDSAFVALDNANNVLIGEQSSHFEVLDRDGNLLTKRYHPLGGITETILGNDGAAVLWRCGDNLPEVEAEYYELVRYGVDFSAMWSYRVFTPPEYYEYADIVTAGMDAAGNLFVVEKPYWRVAKLNAAGVESWKTQFVAFADFQDLTSSAVDPNGNLIFLGYVDREGFSDDLLLKVGQDGQTIWQVQSWVVTDDVTGFGDSCGMAVGPAGRIGLACTSGDDVNTWVFDADGDLLSQNQVYQPTDPHNFLVRSHPDGGLLVGTSGDDLGTINPGLIALRFDDMGGKLWRVTYDPPNNRVANATDNVVDITGLSADSQGNVYVWGIDFWSTDGKAGRRTLPLYYAHNTDTLYPLLKFDPDGNLLWANNFSPETDDPPDPPWTDDDDDKALSAKTAPPEGKADDDDDYLIYVGGGGNIALTDRWSFPPYEEDDDDDDSDDDDASPTPPDDADDDDDDDDSCGCGC